MALTKSEAREKLMNAPFPAAAVEDVNIFYDGRDDAWSVELYGSGTPHPIYLRTSESEAEKSAKKIAKTAVEAGASSVSVGRFEGEERYEIERY